MPLVVAFCCERLERAYSIYTIEGELEKFILLPGMAALYKLVVLDIYKTHNGNTYNDRRELTKQISKLNAKLVNARELLLIKTGSRKFCHHEEKLRGKDRKA